MIGAAPRSARPRRLLLLLLALLFFGPLLASLLIYYGSNWRPVGRTNHGTLIEPPRPLANTVFIGRWSLVYVGAGDCDADCRQTLYFMQQTHRGLGNLASRVQRVFLVSERCCDRAYLKREYPGLITLDQTGSAQAALLAAFPLGARARSLFIVDPRGNLMMRYDSRARPEGLLEDLHQLLQLSSIG